LYSKSNLNDVGQNRHAICHQNVINNFVNHTGFGVLLAGLQVLTQL